MMTNYKNLSHFRVLTQVKLLKYVDLKISLLGFLERERDQYSDEIAEVRGDEVYGELDAVLRHHCSSAFFLRCSCFCVEGGGERERGDRWEGERAREMETRLDWLYSIIWQCLSKLGP